MIVDSCASNWNKFVNWKDIEEHIQLQLGALPVVTKKNNHTQRPLNNIKLSDASKYNVADKVIIY